MNVNQSRIIKLRTVTPIFVGNGDSVKPLSYVLEGNIASVIREDRFFASLSPQERDRFIGWIDPILERLARLKEQIAQARGDFDQRRRLQQKRRQLESSLSLYHFLSSKLGVNPARFIQERGCEAYKVQCNTSPERDGFRLCLKDPFFHPYYPGTEVKGALRTAFIYSLLFERENYAYFKERLIEFRRFFQGGGSPREKAQRLDKIAENVEAHILRGKPRRKTKNDAKFDFFRFLHVSDSSLLSPDSLRVELTQMLGTNRYTRTWVETIAAGREATAQLTVGDSALILQELGLQHLRDWLSIPKLLEACFRRSQDILAEEAEYFADEPILRDLIVSLQEQNDSGAPLLRLGQGQGFLGITVDLHVKHHDPQLFDEAIREGVSFRKHFRTQRGNFPKTRRVITNWEGTPLSLLGWIKIDGGQC